MIILGINDAHDASACLIKNGKLVFAIQEERLTRIKNMGGFPIFSVKKILKKFNLKKSDIDYVAIATKRIVHTNLFNVPVSFSVSDYLKMHEKYYYPTLYKKRKIRISNVFKDFKFITNDFYPMKKIPFVTTSEISSTKIDDLKKLRKEIICDFFEKSEDQVIFYDHHKCHTFHGLYTQSIATDLNRIILATSDGGGDGTYDSVSIFEKGKLTLLSQSRTSLIGKIYSQITLLLGMNPHRHLYKVMGLAPYAQEYYKKGPREVFCNSLVVQGLTFKKNKNMKDYFFYFKEKLKPFRFDGIAGGLQDFTEKRLSEWFLEMYKVTNCNNFIFTGGVANNVKANKMIAENNFVKNFYVPPGPGDEGLSIGAAFCCLYEKNHRKFSYIPLTNAFLSDKPTTKDLKIFESDSLIKSKFKKIKNCSLSKVAKIIRKGEIVGLFEGKMEFGSRALGHRSFIADPSNLETLRKLNDLIKKRDFWMPFTPSIIDRDIKKYIKNKKNIDTNFMTICFDSTKKARIDLIATLHPYDHTIRPQIVKKKTCKYYYNLIEEFRKISGIGALLNTSLNIHEKPIIYKPVEIIKELLKNSSIPLNYLLIEKDLYVRILP